LKAPKITISFVPHLTFYMNETKRQQQVARLIKEEMSLIFQRTGRTYFGHAFVTISGVVLTSDLGEAKIYLSIFQAEDKEALTDKLNEGSWSLRKELGSRIRNKVRTIPEIKFFNDNTLDEAARVDELLRKLKNEEE